MAEETPKVAFKVTFKKDNFDFELPVTTKISELKALLEEKTGVTQPMQKLSYKGKLDDEKTLEECKIKNGTKVLLIGSTLTDILQSNVKASVAATVEKKAEEAAPEEKLQNQLPHKKVVEGGLPDDAEEIKAFEIPLPDHPISGIVNKYSDKLRLSFQLLEQQLVIATKSNTQKIPLNSIRSVGNEPLDKHPGYCILWFQIGELPNNRYYVYFMPNHYITAIKQAVTLYGGF